MSCRERGGEGGQGLKREEGEANHPISSSLGFMYLCPSGQVWVQSVAVLHGGKWIAYSCMRFMLRRYLRGWGLGAGSGRVAVRACAIARTRQHRQFWSVQRRARRSCSQYEIQAFKPQTSSRKPPSGGREACAPVCYLYHAVLGHGAHDASHNLRGCVRDEV